MTVLDRCSIIGDLFQHASSFKIRVRYFLAFNLYPVHSYLKVYLWTFVHELQFEIDINA